MLAIKKQDRNSMANYTVDSVAQIWIIFEMVFILKMKQESV